MSEAMVAGVRRFNRTVTAQVGALNDRYLGRDRPLGEARLLWEIGSEGCELRALRARLGLDSGYLSRLVRSLEAAGLVTVAASDADRRTRVARLTPGGRAERELLDARSDELARSLLEPLTSAQQERLVGAMGEVERLLTAALVEIAPADPAHADARRCLQAYFAELDRRDEAGFDPVASDSAPPHELRPPHGVLLLARLHGEVVGCGGLKGLGRPASESSGSGSTTPCAASASAGACSPSWRPARRRPAPAPCGSTRTATSPRRSRCTGAPATSRSRRSTTSRSRTTGSRRSSDGRGLHLVQAVAERVDERPVLVVGEGVGDMGRPAVDAARIAAAAGDEEPLPPAPGGTVHHRLGAVAILPEEHRLAAPRIDDLEHGAVASDEHRPVTEGEPTAVFTRDLGAVRRGHRSRIGRGGAMPEPKRSPGRRIAPAPGGILGHAIMRAKTDWTHDRRPASAASTGE